MTVYFSKVIFTFWSFPCWRTCMQWFNSNVLSSVGSNNWIQNVQIYSNMVSSVGSNNSPALLEHMFWLLSILSWRYKVYNKLFFKISLRFFSLWPRKDVSNWAPQLQRPAWLLLCKLRFQTVQRSIKNMAWFIWREGPEGGACGCRERMDKKGSSNICLNSGQSGSHSFGKLLALKTFSVCCNWPHQGFLTNKGLLFETAGSERDRPCSLCSISGRLFLPSPLWPVSLFSKHVSPL